MFSSKKIVSLAILSSLPLVLGQTSVNASALVYRQTPKILEKAERSVTRGESDRAIGLLSDKVEDLRRPQFKSTGYGILCVAHYQKQDYVKAEKFCDKAVTVGTPDWSHLNNRGVMRFKLGRYEEAMIDFKSAASIMLPHSDASQRHSVKRNISSAGHRIEAS